MSIEVVTTSKVPPSPNPFSLGIKANGFLFVSGQVGKDATGKVVAGLAAQTEQALKNMAAILEAGGAGFDRVVRVTIYVTDISRLPEVNAIYSRYFAGVLPARATVEVSKLGGGAEIELDAIAVLG